MVHATAVEGLKGGRLRVGMVGGGRNAFIGAVHRMAMRLDDLIELKAGALSSNAENARASGADLGLAPDRIYADYREMAAREAARPDGVEAVVIVTPNHLHFPVAKAFLEAGIDVICDKPLSTTLAEARELVELTRAKGLVFAVTLNNTGYPMVRQAREMIAGGALGEIRVAHAAYIQDWLTLPIDAEGHKQAEWRTDPARAGASACLADIGVHAHNLALFVTGLEVEAVSADLTTFVPGRRLDDNAHVLMRFVGRRARRAHGEPGRGRQSQQPGPQGLRLARGPGMGGRGAGDAALHALWRAVAHIAARRPGKLRRSRSKARACRAAIPRAMSRGSPTYTAARPSSFRPAAPAARPPRQRN